MLHVRDTVEVETPASVATSLIVTGIRASFPDRRTIAENGSLAYQNNYVMMLGSEGLNPHELAHKWVIDFGTRSDMSIKVGYISHDMRILGRIVRVRSTEQSVGILVGAFASKIMLLV